MKLNAVSNSLFIWILCDRLEKSFSLTSSILYPKSPLQVAFHTHVPAQAPTCGSQHVVQQISSTTADPLKSLKWKQNRNRSSVSLQSHPNKRNDSQDTYEIRNNFPTQVRKGGLTLAILASMFLFSFDSSFISSSSSFLQPPSAQAADGAAIGTCLFKKCPGQLAKCISNPKCLANVICINTCNNVADETGCQIQCGDIFENAVVGEFNKCAVSDMTCVPQKKDDGSYPVPAPNLLVSKFDTSLFNGRWYITAGQNKLFDVFPCQVHFFSETAPGKFFGKLNWRIEEPDGEFFTRDALQRFVQDPKQPGHLINHDNDYLHYEDDWYVLDYEADDNASGTPPFALVYYRGSNDAWVGYGGVVVYTRDSKLPTSLIPRLRTAVQKVNFDFDKDFAVTDNTCSIMDKSEAILLREKFAGNVAIQTETQLQQQAVIARGNAVNSAKAQKLFVNDELDQVVKAYSDLREKAEDFEKEVLKDVEIIEKVVVDDVKSIEKVVVDDVKSIEKAVIPSIN